jgi:hypothetical protein
VEIGVRSEPGGRLDLLVALRKQSAVSAHHQTAARIAGTQMTAAVSQTAENHSQPYSANEFDRRVCAGVCARIRMLLF